MAACAFLHLVEEKQTQENGWRQQSEALYHTEVKSGGGVLIYMELLSFMI